MRGGALPEGDHGAAEAGSVQVRSWSGEVAGSLRNVAGLRHTLARGFLRAVVVSTLAIGLTLMAAQRAHAQDAPDAPSAVAVYSIVGETWSVTTSDELDVRWSSSDTSVTGFIIQWKSGAKEFASSRQDQVAASAALVEFSSTETSKRYKHTIDGLTDGTEYTVRVIANNAHGDSEPWSEVTGTPDATVGLSALAFIQAEVVPAHATDFPWLQDTVGYLAARNVPVVFQPGSSGIVGSECFPGAPLEDGLQTCRAVRIVIGQHSIPPYFHTVVHELAHVYTLASNVTMDLAPSQAM